MWRKVDGKIWAKDGWRLVQMWDSEVGCMTWVVYGERGRGLKEYRRFDCDSEGALARAKAFAEEIDAEIEMFGLTEGSVA